MGRARKFDEPAVVEAVSGLFWRKGYLATSTRDIEALTGLSSASLYNTFRDKRSLFARGLEVYADRRLRSRFRAVSHLSPVERVEAFVELVISGLADPDGTASCLIVNSTLELSQDEPDLRAKVESYLGEVEAFLLEALRQGKAEGGIRSSLPAEDIAKGVLAMLMGLHVLAKTRPGIEALQAAARPILSLLRDFAGTDNRSRSENGLSRSGVRYPRR